MSIFSAGKESTLPKMKKRRKSKTKPPSLFDYIVALIAGGFIGSLASIITICVINSGLPKEGFFSNIYTAAIPGAVVGLLLGLVFPKFFFIVGDAIATHLL